VAAGGDKLDGKVTQGSVITAATLVGNTTGSVTLANANVLGTLGNFTAGALSRSSIPPSG